MIKHILYLHGLGSSPASNKARFFAQKLTAHNPQLTVPIPDLNVPTFEKLTLTAMLARVAEEIRTLPTEGGVALIGSSMGGLTALHFIDRYREKEAKRVEKLVLLAPALEFMDESKGHFGEGGFAAWRARGYLNWFHHGYGEERKLHYGLVEDVQQYDSFAVTLEIPILIHHGKNDESVDFHHSVRYAVGRANVDLRLLDSDHQLLDKTDDMLVGIVTFLGV
jgi:hypothetical protein